MIKRYVSTDIPDIRAFLLPEPDKYIQFHTGMQAVDMLYFDIWLSRARGGQLTAVLFRSYGDFCLRVTPEADLEELAGFIRFLPMLTTLSCDAATAEHLLPQLDQVRAVTPCAVAVQSAPGPVLPFELDYRRAGSMEDFRQVFDLLGNDHPLVTQYRRRLYQALY